MMRSRLLSRSRRRPHRQASCAWIGTGVRIRSAHLL